MLIAVAAALLGSLAAALFLPARAAGLSSGLAPVREPELAALAEVSHL
jgi:hypothetical protein